ncbi:AI-2E family transporter [Oscillatoriales cyanobacterium LEGE 11467]|uniref:AI-2E family transporter n=1 Tax=Zarconia navalis LEGE 11467 TaxID=1828826 RepID=A0A928ZA90_9CYAN|nr:AI-2E family transporter [Zarconia navalis]MBE9042594.1 AI-2E family transporter [Zarconia navalis LEGE 11467]
MKPAITFPSWVTWGLVFPLIALNGWLFLVVFEYFHSFVTVLVSATLLAFILNYPVRFLTGFGVKRGWAVLGTIAMALLLVALLGVTLGPIAYRQFEDLADRLPSWIESGTQQLQSLNDWAGNRNLPIDVSGLTAELTGRLSGQLQSLVGQILDTVLGTLGSVVDLLLTFVLAFYILLHGEQVWEGICEWLPQPLGSHIRPLLGKNFHNYYVGQASLAAIVGSSMTVAFALLKVPFGLLFGLGVGFMALFPFGAGLSICIVSVLTALKSVWLGVRVLVAATIVEQIIESGIAPRLLGEFIGLNPVWVLISLLVGAKVAGVLGVLIAVPIAGFLKGIAAAMRSNGLDGEPLSASGNSEL